MTQWNRHFQSASRTAWLWLTVPLMASGAESNSISPADVEFFEGKVRPILVEHCYECHSQGAKRIEVGLRLDSGAAVLQGGDSGAVVVPGNIEASLLVQAVRWQSLEMPPRGKLGDSQVSVLIDWVARGVPWPQTASDIVDGGRAQYNGSEDNWSEVRRSHWAWQPPQRPAVPAVNDSRWCKSPIDYFVLSGLEAHELTPSSEAEPQVLIRRICWDLIGLPPAPSEVKAFEIAFAKNADSAIADVIDRLLDSPHYGERWARKWLDIARYSDQIGTFGGPAIPHAWRYRDWVIAALNRDLPYDQFLRYQIAGDLASVDQSVATGFLALGPTYVSDGGDPDATAQALAETLDDRVDTLTRGLLGMTVSCARCHDHKFDPIPQLDYYSLAGVFHNTKIIERPQASVEYVQSFQRWQQSIQDREKRIAALTEMAKAEQREPTADEREELDRLRADIASLLRDSLAPYPVAHSLSDTGSTDMHLAIRGNLRKPGPVAPRRFLRVLSDDNGQPLTQGSGRRELAEAIAQSGNPLTARVMVNRVWAHLFGQGLVRSVSNFGVTGEKPTHPELLDWLSVEFSCGSSHDDAPKWSLKQLLKSIMISSTYRMSSQSQDRQSQDRGLEVDADNRQLRRFQPRRLDVEAWRDSILAVTGELDRTMGGPAVDNLMTTPRRTIYGGIDRNGEQYAHQTFLRLFDFPLAKATSEGRTTSAMPQQSLFMLNSSFMADRARALAVRLQRESTTDDARIELAYRLLFSRAPTDAEQNLGQEFVARADEPANGKLTRWEQYAQVLLSASELIYVE